MGVIGFFVVSAIFVAAAVVVPATIFGLLRKDKSRFIVRMVGIPLSVFLLYYIVVILLGMNAVKQRRIHNESVRKATDAISEYYRISPEKFVRIGEDEEVQIRGFSDWLLSSNGRADVFTDGDNPTDATKRKIRVAVDFDKDFIVHAFGMDQTVCYPDSVASKTYTGALGFFGHDEQGNVSWWTHSFY